MDCLTITVMPAITALKQNHCLTAAPTAEKLCSMKIPPSVWLRIRKWLICSGYGLKKMNETRNLWLLN